MLSGSWEVKGQGAKKINHQFLCNGDAREEMCHRIWDLETIGISESTDSEKKNSDGHVLEHFNQFVVYEWPLCGSFALE